MMLAWTAKALVLSDYKIDAVPPTASNQVLFYWFWIKLSYTDDCYCCNREEGRETESGTCNV